MRANELYKFGAHIHFFEIVVICEGILPHGKRALRVNAAWTGIC
ncbi:hypothetical protein C8R32_1281 [Nitrosospira sp. Nsp5]|uniref:Uncharacterized protein n=1 Tax=Nitrosospira multiformis TaxID=1231 RepID=A0ABY0T682_9PROT|nr:hypothetical protein C8R32_1281 [Nitrosospira sp. Nsp5]SDQ31418.1 hypothetical protein SAMN05216402_0329 [Nitrosospira multiformis]